jgi:DNA transposition AAA+ family ATPase
MKTTQTFVDFKLTSTEITTKMAIAMNQAKKFREMKLVTGPSGVGKTKAIQYCIQDDPNATYILCRRGMRKNRFLKAIAEKYGIKKKMSYDDYLDELADTLTDKHLLVIDEPEHITIEAVEGLRYLNECTGCAIVMVGLDSFHNYLKGHRRDFEYVYNRLGVPYKATSLKVKDFEKLLDKVLPIEYAAYIADLAMNNSRFFRNIVRMAKDYASDHAIKEDDSDKMKKIFDACAKELDVKGRLK